MKLSTILFLLLIATLSFAQSTNVDTTVNKNEIKKVKFDEVLITGKYEQTSFKLPYSISVVTNEEIVKNATTLPAALIKENPGITLIKDGIWGTDVNIRGLNRNNVVVLIDGNRLETSNDISARLSLIDAFDVERIEVIKGAASSLYGTGATGGVVNILSRQGSYNSELYIKGTLSGSYNTANKGVHYGADITAGSDIWYLKIAGSFKRASDTESPSGIIKDSRYNDNNLSALFSLKPMGDHELKLNYQDFYAYDVGIPGGNLLFPTIATVRYPDERRQTGSLDYSIKNLSSSFKKLSFKYYHTFIQRNVENLPHAVAVTNTVPKQRVSTLSINPGADHNTDGINLQTDFLFGDNYLIAGIDAWKRSYTGERSRIQKIEVFNAAGDSVVRINNRTTIEKPLPNSSFSNAGVYVHDEFTVLKDKLSLTLGARYDYIFIKNDKTYSPLYEILNGVTNTAPASQKLIWNGTEANNKSYSYNAGVLYSLLENLNLSFSFSHAFRSPSLEERFQYIDLGNSIRVGDVNLKPEKGYYYDFGIRFNHSNIKVQSSLFYTSLTDLVSEERAVIEGRNGFKKINIGKAALYGFDLSVNYRVINEVSVYGMTSYVRGENKKDNQNLPQIPPINGNFGVVVNVLDFAEVDLSTSFFGDQNNIAAGEIKTPGYALYNAAIGIKKLDYGFAGITFYAGVENIFDKNYRDHLSTNRGTNTLEPGRNFYIKTYLTW